MSILVTGGSGFVGSHLLRMLADIYGEDEIVVISSSTHSKYRTIKYDPINFSFQNKQLPGVNILVHAGAFTPKSYDDANNISKCSGNIQFTEHLLNISLPDLKRIIYLSTLDVYDAEPVISENSRILPATLYGASKYYCERLIQAYGKVNSTSVNILRIGHVYGPGEEKYQKMLPRTLQNVIQGKTVELWTDGSELRTFIYIDDVVRAIIQSIKTREEFDVINVVGGKALSICELLEEINSIAEENINLEKKDDPIKGRSYLFDNSMLKQYLLEDETDFKVGLKKEYEYFKSKLCH